MKKEQEHKTTVIRFNKRNYEIDIDVALDYIERLKNAKCAYTSDEKLIQDIKDCELWDNVFIEAVAERTTRRRKA